MPALTDSELFGKLSDARQKARAPGRAKLDEMMDVLDYVAEREQQGNRVCVQEFGTDFNPESMRRLFALENLSRLLQLIKANERAVLKILSQGMQEKGKPDYDR